MNKYSTSSYVSKTILSLLSKKAFSDEIFCQFQTWLKIFLTFALFPDEVFSQLEIQTKLPLFSNKKFPNEVFSQFRGLREELLVELVVAGDDVGIGLLLRVAKKWRRSRQPSRKNISCVLLILSEEI